MKPKEISLTKGMTALVDDGDYDFLMQWKWYAASGGGKKFYARRGIYIPIAPKMRKQIVIAMHSLICPAPDGMETDHINGDTLDNRRCNLRACIHSHNMRNLPKPRDGKTSSPYKGVSWHKDHECWQAMIKKNYKQKWLGNFDDPKEAALAYNNAATEHFGEYAKLNII